jgi:hypothetical protein
MITKDLNGPYGSARYVMRDDDGREQDVYQGREASAISALLSRKVDPDVVLTVLFGRDHGQPV